MSAQTGRPSPAFVGIRRTRWKTPVRDAPGIEDDRPGSLKTSTFNMMARGNPATRGEAHVDCSPYVRDRALFAFPRITGNRRGRPLRGHASHFCHGPTDREKSRRLFHGTRYPALILASGFLKTAEVGPNCVCFSRSPEVAAFSATLPREDGEGSGAIMVFDRASLKTRYKLECYADRWLRDGHTVNEFEERVYVRDIEISSHLIGLVTTPKASVTSKGRAFRRAAAIRLARESANCGCGMRWKSCRMQEETIREGRRPTATRPSWHFRVVVRPNGMHVSSYHSCGWLIGGTGAIAISCDFCGEPDCVVAGYDGEDHLWLKCRFGEKSTSAGE
jgi:hypothetical protein